MKGLLHTLTASSVSAEGLTKRLPDHLAQEMRAFAAPEVDDLAKLLSQSGWMEQLHYSWYVRPLRGLPHETQNLFLSLLPSNQALAVCKLLGRPFTSIPFSPFMRPYLIDELKRKLVLGLTITPEPFLPRSELNFLLVLTKKDLLSVIDLLGVHDLSADLRQIVDKVLLKKIYEALSTEQLRFLHYCTKQPMKWISPKLGLMSWDGSKKKLHHMLHARGLMRLGRALFGEDESLTWHLTHHLDIGRAGVIEKALRQKQDLALVPYFKSQVLHILKRYAT